MAAASFRWIVQLHKDVSKAARFYLEGLDFTVNVCTLRWAELQSGPLKLAIMQSHSRLHSTRKLNLQDLALAPGEPSICFSRKLSVC
ncbi:Lactoylglutathione lyase / glyoxalase I family protein [Melia azedarach]|uniref:Lactoylglutathione lyase / glyoxalase I family protein n=1 Tax=Melia azedarach TaxID=155640 RepID=A0ACC1YII4_MELAZ|nr:Lactoylglutathione lyase / glyoxalase I family protein [Melia azedarach]